MKSVSNLKLRDIASSDVFTVTPDSSLDAAVRQFADHHVSSLLVVEAGKPVGIVTERDLVRLMCHGLADGRPVSEVMTAPVLTAPDHLDFSAARMLMANRGIRHIVLVDATGRMTGVATETDFRRHLGSDFFQSIKSLGTVMDRGISLLAPEWPLAVALESMAAGRLDHVLIGRDGKATGILTERDVPRLLARHLDPAMVKLADVMTSTLQTIDVATSVVEAAGRMQQSGLRHLVVLDQAGRVVGVVSQHRMLDRLGVVLLDESRDKLESRLDVVLDATGVGTWEYDHSNGVVTRSAALNSLFKFPADMQNDTVADILQRIDPDDRAEAEAVFKEVMSGRSSQFSVDYREQGGDGDTRWVSVRGRVVESDEQGLPLRTVGVTIDLTEQRQAQALLELSNAILQRISMAAPLAEVFELVAREIELREPGTLCSILLLDESGQRLRHGAGPSLPPTYLAAIDGAQIGPQVGSCGTAAYLKAPVFVADIASDPLWADYRELALQHDLAACWSSPIFAVSGAVLGTFAIYWQMPRPEVGPIVRRYVEMATRLVGIAIENAQREGKLQGMLDELRRWQQLTLGREGRVLELKREINALLGRLGEAPAYPSVVEEGPAT